MDLHAEQIFEILRKGNVVKQGTARFPFHQEIQVAFGRGITAGDRSKDTNTAGTVALSKGQNFPSLLVP
jgi:hypothetical protein